MARLNIAPEPEMIESYIARSSTLKENLAELIDNSFDQEATRIEIASGKDSLIVEDNGLGISDWLAMLRIGTHRASRTVLGRFGVGFKHAAAWLAEMVDIETRHNDAYKFTRLDWAGIMRSGWDIEVGEPHLDSGPSYTKLVFKGIHFRRLQNLDKAAEDLAYSFTPALKAGKEIFVNGTALLPVALPPIDGRPLIEEGDFGFKRYRLTAGVKADHTMPRRSGYDVAYMHRLVRQHDLTGFQNYSAQRFYGYLELLSTGEEDWSLADHKDEFAERQELYQELFPIIEPLLQRAAQVAEDLEFRDCQRELNSRISKLLEIDPKNSKENGNAKEKRSSGESHGTAEPADSGRKRRHAKEFDEAQKGNIIAKLKNRGIRITFDYADMARIGEVQTGAKMIIVSLNPQYEIVKKRNQDTLVSIVCGLLVMDKDWSHSNRQLFLPHLDPFAKPDVDDYSELIRRATMFGIYDSSKSEMNMVTA